MAHGARPSKALTTLLCAPNSHLNSWHFVAESFGIVAAHTHIHTHMGVCTKLCKSVGATKTSLLTASFICRVKKTTGTLRIRCVWQTLLTQFQLATSDSGSYQLQNIRSAISAPSMYLGLIKAKQRSKIPKFSLHARTHFIFVTAGNSPTAPPRSPPEEP